MKKAKKDDFKDFLIFMSTMMVSFTFAYFFTKDKTFRKAILKAIAEKDKGELKDVKR